jgi:hypothetical protein
VAVLAQIDGYDPVAAASVSVQASSVDDDRVCHLNGQTWWPGLAKPPALRYDLIDGGFSGRIDTPSSSIELAVELWPNLPRYALGDARVRVWTGEPSDAWGSWTLRFDGRATGQPTVGDGMAALEIAVDDRWLDSPLLATYAGTGGAEGEAAQKGRPKPLAIGAPRYCPGNLIDTANLVFDLSAYGLIEDVEAALEGLASFGASVGDYASQAALVAATIPAGRWATSKAAGKVRHGAPAAQGRRFVYHVKGDKAGPDGWVRRPGSVIKRLALLAGGSGRTHDASLAALDTARPYNVSWHIRDQVTAREAIQRIAASVNAVAGVNWLGQLFVAPIPDLSGSATITLDSSGTRLPAVAKVDQIAMDPPFWRISIEAERTEDVHALSEVAFTAVLVDVGLYDAARTYREGNVVTLDDGSNWVYVAVTPTAGNAPVIGSVYWQETFPGLGSGAGGALPGQLLRDDKFISTFWSVPAPAGRVAWAGSRSDYAVTIPFVASTDFRIAYEPTAATALPRTTAGKTMYARVLLDPSGFSGVQVIDDDGTPIVDDDGLYVVDADPADFDLEVAIVWQNADGSFNSRSIIATLDPDDGVQTVEGNAIAPVTGFAVLELGYPSQTGKTGAWTAYEPWLAEYEPTADVTAQAQVSVELTPLRSYEADYLGVIGTGLPDTVSPRVTRGGASIKTDDATSYEITPSSGITATRDNTTGSATKGDISITAVDTLDGWIDLAVSVGGVAQPTKRMSVRKSLGSAPSGGGSGSKRASTGSFTDVTTTSYVRIAFVGTVTVASGESLYANASLDYYIGGSGGFRTASVKLRYAPTGTTSWTDIGAAATGSGATGYTTPEGFFEPANPGHVDYAQSATPSAATYDVEIVALESSTGRTMTFAGVAAVEAKV